MFDMDGSNILNTYINQTQINILPFPGLAQSGTEQPGQCKELRF